MSRTSRPAWSRDGQIVGDATVPPAPLTTTLVWTRASTGRWPSPDDRRPHLLLTTDGRYVVAQPGTMTHAIRLDGSSVEVRRSAVPQVQTVTTHFRDGAGQPLGEVAAWAPIEELGE